MEARHPAALGQSRQGGRSELLACLEAKQLCGGDAASQHDSRAGNPLPLDPYSSPLNHLRRAEAEFPATHVKGMRHERPFVFTIKAALSRGGLRLGDSF